MLYEQGIIMNPMGPGGAAANTNTIATGTAETTGGGIGISGDGNEKEKESSSSSIPGDMQQIMKMSHAEAEGELARLITDIVRHRRMLKILTDKHIQRTRTHLRKQEDRIKKIMGCKKYRKISFPRYNITIHRCMKDPAATYKIQEVRAILGNYFGGSDVSRSQVDNLINAIEELKRSEHTKKIHQFRSEHKYHRVYKLQFEVENEEVAPNNDDEDDSNNITTNENATSTTTGSVSFAENYVLQAGGGGGGEQEMNAHGRGRGRGMRGGRGGRRGGRRRMYELRDIISKCSGRGRGRGRGGSK
jgi:hypothetical protein